MRLDQRFLKHIGHPLSLVSDKLPDERQIYELQKIINYANHKERVRLLVVRSGIGGDFGDLVVAGGAIVTPGRLQRQQA